MATYGFDESKNKKEVYTKEEVITILQQAIESGSTAEVDPSLAPIPEAVKEKHAMTNVSFWVGSESEFEELGADVGYFIGRVDQNKNVYIITDDQALDSIERELKRAADNDVEIAKLQTNKPNIFIKTSSGAPSTDATQFENLKVGDFCLVKPGGNPAAATTYQAVAINEELQTVYWKTTIQDALTAGENVKIKGGVISTPANAIIAAAVGKTINLNDCSNYALDSIIINGESSQNGTPTIDNPVAIENVGDNGGTVNIEINETDHEITTGVLRGIKVSSGGNYTDENGQQWICDTIERYTDGTGKHIKRVNALILDGSENWSNAGNRVNATLNIPDFLESTPTTICSHLQLGSSGADITNNDNKYIITNGKMLASPTQNGTRLAAADFKTFLQSNNITLLHPLETPIETELTAEQIAALEALETEKPQTAINSEAGLNIGYVADAKTYIDNKFAELSAE